MKRISFIVLLLVILGQSGLHACTCSSSTYNFVSNLNTYDFVGLVEIIGRDTIINYELDRTFTVVKIIKQYKGMIQNDTVKVLESGGAIRRSLKLILSSHSFSDSQTIDSG